MYFVIIEITTKRDKVKQIVRMHDIVWKLDEKQDDAKLGDANKSNILTLSRWLRHTKFRSAIKVKSLT